MFARDIVKAEIDRLDEQYLDLIFKIISQFPRRSNTLHAPATTSRCPSDILNDIAKAGGLGIHDPVAWQKDVRQDRELPCRAN